MERQRERCAEMLGAPLEDASVQCAEEMGCCEAIAGKGRSLKELVAGGGEDLVPICGVRGGR